MRGQLVIWYYSFCQTSATCEQHVLEECYRPFEKMSISTRIGTCFELRIIFVQDAFCLSVCPPVHVH